MSQTKLDNVKGLYLEGIRDGNAQLALDKYIGAEYKQHSTGVRDGKEGFLEFFIPFLERNPQRDIQIRRSFVDGDMVFVHVYQSLNNGLARWVTTDFFLTDDDDKIIEHWDVIARFSDYNKAGHDSIDGPTEIEDLEKTEENKSLVRAMLEDAFMDGGNPNNLERYISEDEFIQHNSEEIDGIGGYQLLASDPERPIIYRKIVHLIGSGNFVACFSKISKKIDGDYKDFAHVDVFRIEDGLIVEHWDNEESVPQVSVNSGKF